MSECLSFLETHRVVQELLTAIIWDPSLDQWVLGDLLLHLLLLWHVRHYLIFTLLHHSLISTWISLLLALILGVLNIEVRLSCVSLLLPIHLLQILIVLRYRLLHIFDELPVVWPLDRYVLSIPYELLEVIAQLSHNMLDLAFRFKVSNGFVKHLLHISYELESWRVVAFFKVSFNQTQVQVVIHNLWVGLLIRIRLVK